MKCTYKKAAKQTAHLAIKCTTVLATMIPKPTILKTEGTASRQRLGQNTTECFKISTDRQGADNIWQSPSACQLERLQHSSCKKSQPDVRPGRWHQHCHCSPHDCHAHHCSPLYSIAKQYSNTGCTRIVIRTIQPAATAGNNC